MVDMGNRLVGTVAVTFALALGVACHRAPQVDNSQHAPAIQRIVTSSPSWIDRDKLGSTLWKAEREFYQSRNHLPAWIEGDEASPRLDGLIDALKHAEDHGLDPARYGTSNFQKIVDAANANKGRYELAKIPEFDTRQFPDFHAYNVGGVRLPRRATPCFHESIGILAS